ncbi:hypothetical protein [uncultured Rubinisphaera sp.]|uniref:hypothetical protein n=1 Tax=uncultured Rubinisphaera sp. TaxID=1678686 RepID=UPI0030DDAD0E
MLFLGIDQHARQLTVSFRDQQGDVLLARQVPTRPAWLLSPPLACRFSGET